ncbi:MAG: 16S rRNA (cytosine(1402)-N(4))-methyltransferase RsmH [Nitrospira sp.]|nr:16S rRNA (cytosine(1402)-N(4))-methyltransferase RsmH [Candidatus Manganitrophaceae bacterium]HIL33815.1 16S rRNA (cytosine(1402)-N(4))-methyltransferase RsmH [Candidatus Manganitrophaceae bacterium]
MAIAGLGESSEKGESVHRPVLVKAVLEALACQPVPEKIYLDCTVGAGGHTEAILNQTAPYGRVIGLDRDDEILKIAEKRLSGFSDRLVMRQGSFCEMGQIIKDLHLSEVDGILFDFGVSSLQLDRAERGFSFQKPGPLDMRMDRGQKETAADWVNRLSQEELADVIWRYGEDRWSRRISSGIVRYRDEKGKIVRTEELEGIIWKAVPAKYRHGRIHPATRTFQALRIVVNQELEQIELGLAQAMSLMAVGGRLTVISFHSLEDRCVKQTFKKAVSPGLADREKRFINLYKKPLVAGPEEISQNPRARSAKLRCLERAA